MKPDKLTAILARLSALEAEVFKPKPGNSTVPAHVAAIAAAGAAAGDPYVWSPGNASFINGAAPTEEGVRISYPAPARPSVMPSIGELHQLLAIVQRTYPKLAPKFHDELQFFEAFSRAFLYVGTLGRSDELNNRVSISWWVDECETWLKRSDVHGDISASGFAAACLAQGIDYLAGDPAVGTVWTFALKAHGGRPDKGGDGWRGVLSAGRIKPPLQPKGSYATNYPAPQAIVTVVGG